ncbi:MAG TPA: hypothetical protein VGL66_05095 [Caulobacteraceae bacterium]|jgi:hypothetical protein
MERVRAYIAARPLVVAAIGLTVFMAGGLLSVYFLDDRWRPIASIVLAVGVLAPLFWVYRQKRGALETVGANAMSVGQKPPDLSTPEGAAAYRAELRAAGFWPRQIGYGLVIAAAITLIWMRWGHGSQSKTLCTAAMAVMAVGWVLLITAILMRSRYNRRRMRGE